MLISDWSSDVCSSDLLFIVRHKENIITVQRMQGLKDYVLNAGDGIEYFEIESGGDPDRFKSILARALDRYAPRVVDRQRVGWGKSLTGRVFIGVRRMIRQTKIII